jgi:hypothetical protein
VRRDFSRRVTAPCLALVMMLCCVPYVLAAQNGADSCLDCHTNADQLKKISMELEKKKLKKSAETAGEG